MTVQSHSGGAGSWQRAMKAGPHSKPGATIHLVHGDGAVDDGANGTHDYDVTLHPALLGRLDAHGARLDEHDDRIKRLEGSTQAQLGSPKHDGGS